MRSKWFFAIRGTVAGGLLVLAAIATTGGAASAGTACTIVPNPTDQHFTSCPDANLQGANLSNLNLDYANFARADLTGANLSNSSLRQASLDDAKLGSANLRYANLYAAVLIGVSAPSGTTLSNANLSWTDLENATLTNDDADYAIFDHAYFNGAILSGSSLRGASFAETSVMPGGVLVEAASESGAEVSYNTTSVAPVPGVQLTSCSPAPGFFPVGFNTVTCGTVDDFGNSGTGSFTAIVALPSSLSAQPAIVSSSGNVLSMTAHLADGINAKPIAGGWITFWQPNGRAPICEASTDSNGVATCTIRDPNTIGQVIAAGGYKAYYDGLVPGQPYLPSQASAGVAG